MEIEKIDPETYVSFPQTFQVYSENVKLLEALTEDLKKIGYNLDDTWGSSGNYLNTLYSNLDFYNKDVEKFKKITYCNIKLSFHQNFVLPEQYLEVLKFAKEQTENSYWGKEKKKNNFNKREWLYLKCEDSVEFLFRFSLITADDIVISEEFYRINKEGEVSDFSTLKQLCLVAENVTKATNDQITRILSKVAKEKGYLEGVSFIDSVHNKVFEISYENFDTFNKQDRLYVKVCKNNLSNKTASVYRDGIWAEIVKSKSLKFGDLNVTVYPQKYAETTYGKITKEELEKAIDWINNAPSILSYAFTIHSSFDVKYKKITDNDSIVGFGCQKGYLSELKTILKELE